MATTLSRRRRQLFRHPTQVVVVAFAGIILIGTLLLLLPVSRDGSGNADFVTALFTSTSAVCVTGLIVVDTPSYWSGFGEGVIMGLIQVGGFGIMTLASLLGLLVFRRLGLRSRMTAATERTTGGLGDVRGVVKGVFTVTVITEFLVAAILALRFWLSYDEPWDTAIYHGVFHSISSFNNAGFALWTDSLMPFVTDPVISVTIALSVIAGGLGFPVWVELWRRAGHTWAWSIHTRMTLAVTAILIVVGTVFITANEWTNAGTLGPLSVPGKILAGFFQAVMPRTAGFNSVDIGAMDDGTLLGIDVLMLIGGGSAGTAGGIKVTTFVLLFFAILAEVRGDRSVTAFGRRVDDRAIRQALTVALLAVAMVMVSTIALLELTDHELSDVLFEVTSAFGTVGLSTGITADLPTSGHMILIVLMFAGRLGPITLVSALALRDRDRLYELPEGRPLIG